MSALAPRLRRAEFSRESWLRTALVFATAGLVAFAVVVQLSQRSFLLALALGVVLVAAAGLFVSQRYEITLLALMVYLCVADGPLKLLYGGNTVSFARDVLFGAIVAGALSRLFVRRTAIVVPPLTPFVVAWFAIVVAQVANPNNGSVSHTLQALRPHLEWVPLFFFGYFVMRTPTRIRRFLLILLGLTAINGIVALVQYQLGPDAVAAWGPGYHRIIFGGNGIAGRTFVDNAGMQRLRPPALGSDTGFGGALAALAAPAVLVLLTLARRRFAQLAALLLGAGVVIALFTSQARIFVIGTVVSLVAVVVLGIASRRIGRLVLASAVAAFVVYVAVVSLSGNAGVFDRFASISGNKAGTTSVAYKKGTYAVLADEIKQYPFGAGLGSVGPGSSVAAGPSHPPLSGESEFNYLQVEVGMPGLLILLALSLTLVAGSAARIRATEDPETRILLAAMAAPVAALLFLWFGGPVSASPPAAPFFWLTAGTLAYWCFDRQDGAGS